MALSCGARAGTAPRHQTRQHDAAVARTITSSSSSSSSVMGHRRRAVIATRAAAAPGGNGSGSSNGPPAAAAAQAAPSPPPPTLVTVPPSPKPFVGLPGDTHAKIMDCVRFVRARAPALVPQLAIVLGSGLGGVADDVEGAVTVPYAEIPHFHAPGVAGHPGKLVLGHLRGVPALVLQGRFHFYEGHPMDEVILPIRVAKYLGCIGAVITNAAGGLNPAFAPGDIMLLEDHINFFGANPLRGPNPPELGGPRFLDLSEPYDPQYRSILRAAAARLGLPPLRRGVYLGVSGPTYETRAEVRMFRALGADAVGMSTVPEVIAARHLGLRVAALSCITNLACGLGGGEVSHEDVMAEGARAADRLRRLLGEAVPLIAGAAAAAAGGGPAEGALEHE